MALGDARFGEQNGDLRVNLAIRKSQGGQTADGVSGTLTGSGCGTGAVSALRKWGHWEIVLLLIGYSDAISGPIWVIPEIRGAGERMPHRPIVHSYVARRRRLGSLYNGRFVSGNPTLGLGIGVALCVFTARRIGYVGISRFPTGREVLITQHRALPWRRKPTKFGPAEMPNPGDDSDNPPMVLREADFPPAQGDAPSRSISVEEPDVFVSPKDPRRHDRRISIFTEWIASGEMVLRPYGEIRSGYSATM